MPFNGKRRLPVGAELLDGGAHFRVWAAGTRQVELVLAPGDAGGRERTIALEPESAGYFSVFLPDMRAGVLYGFRLDGRGPFPDPASRFQPDGPHGPSELIDPSFPWTDAGWSGPELKGQVFYELHVGTFTHEGNWSAATRHLPRLAQLGITTVEVMPVADFAGRFGWGYDGVNLFAPTRLYGRPEEFRRFIDVAHSLGLAVILDVVYNHLGPDGNYLAEFSPAYFNRHYRTAWGDAINFDGEDSGPVREYFLANAEYWVREFHLDGFRLDATQEIYDESGDHIVAALVRRVRQAAAGRATLVIAENEKQEVKLVQHPEEGGYGVDGLWNDDFHHSARVAVTGRSEGYYTDFLGSSQELVSAVKWGYLFQGQYYHWLQQRRGSPTFGLPPHIFVSYLENHDQIANSRSGERLHQIANPGQLRALTSLLLLGPGTPLLFQGQEFGASSPFVFFADHGGDLAANVRRGRAGFLRQFSGLQDPTAVASIPDPCSHQTFLRCKLDHDEHERHPEWTALHVDLLALRRNDPVFRPGIASGVDGATLGHDALVLRFFGPDHDDRLLLVNLGATLRLTPAPEPLLAPPTGRSWELIHSTDDVRYGGPGVTRPELERGWVLPSHSAVALAARPAAPNDATGRASGGPPPWP